MRAAEVAPERQFQAAVERCSVGETRSPMRRANAEYEMSGMALQPVWTVMALHGEDAVSVSTGIGRRRSS